MIGIDYKNIENLYNSYDVNYLSKLAEKICLLNYGNKVFLRGLLEFSNECKMNCIYCGLRKDNKKINRYSISPNEVINIISNFYKYGFRSFVLQSGEFVTYKINDLCFIIYNLKKLYNDIAITLSCGYFNKKELKIFKDYGADRYLLRFETADSKIYKYLKNGLSLKKRIDMLYNLKELNFETGSGFMVGLPYETDEILIKNLKLCYDLKLDMIGIGPFIPNPDTPLGNFSHPKLNKIKKLTAILRIILPFSNIPATLASGTLYSNGREKLLKAGANVLMQNITPYKYKKNYLLYPKKICIINNYSENIKKLRKNLKKINREISLEKGQSFSYIYYSRKKGSDHYVSY